MGAGPNRRRSLLRQAEGALCVLGAAMGLRERFALRVFDWSVLEAAFA